MSSDGDEMLTVCVSMLRRDFNKLTHMVCEETFEAALVAAACEQITSYKSRVDPRGEHPYVITNPIDPG